MKQLKEFDKVGHNLASIQARIFSESLKDKIASYAFIKIFMHHPMVESMDDLSFDTGVISEQDIYATVVRSIKNKNRGTLYSDGTIHWIGYFYRAFCYVTNYSSKTAFKLISPTYLQKVYIAYHSQDIVKAIQWVIDDRRIPLETDKERIMRILRETA